VIVLWQASRTPVVGAAWRVTSAQGSETLYRTDLHGEMELPVGQVTVESLDATIVLPFPECTVQAAAPAILWASQRATIQVQVRELDGRPIAGAKVAWHHWPVSRDLVPQTTTAAETETDATGLAILVDAPGCGIDLLVRKVGYTDCLLPLVVPCAEVDVVLGPERALAFLRVVEAGHGRPVPGVTARGVHGPLTMTSNAAGTYELQLGLATDGRTVLEAPGYCPRELVLSGHGSQVDPIEVELCTGEIIDARIMIAWIWLRCFWVSKS
jgi:hypothetical protein